MSVISKLEKYLNEASSLSIVGLDTKTVKYVHTKIGVDAKTEYKKLGSKREATNELVNKQSLLIIKTDEKNVIIEPINPKSYHVYEFYPNGKVETYTITTKSKVATAIPTKHISYYASVGNFNAGRGEKPTQGEKNRDARSDSSIRAGKLIGASIQTILSKRAEPLYQKSLALMNKAINDATPEEINSLIWDNSYNKSKDLKKGLEGIKHAKYMQDAQKGKWGEIADDLLDALKAVYPEVLDRRFSYGGMVRDELTRIIVSISTDQPAEYSWEDDIVALDTPENVVRKMVVQYIKDVENGNTLDI